MNDTDDFSMLAKAEALKRERGAMQAVVEAARAWREEDEMDDTKAVRALLRTLGAYDKETGRVAEERR